MEDDPPATEQVKLINRQPTVSDVFKIQQSFSSNYNICIIDKVT